MAQEAPAIGIDLGTTYSVVGVYRKRKVEIIANDAGKRTTPSYVAFTDEEEYVGEAAKEMATKNTLYDSKRLIGRRYEDEEVQEDIPNWPFTILNDGGIPKYSVFVDIEEKLISPEEISAKILGAMKTTAEDSLDTEVTKAVITVPAYFNESQRQATKAAGVLAGLDVIDILNEPTAAALAFGFSKGKNSTVLIFDLGGGTFDLTVLEFRGNTLKIRAHGGDTHLGGQDFDSRVLNYVIDDIKDSMGIDIRADDDAEEMHELRASCEVAKRKLSTLPQATINCYLSRHDRGYKKDLTRATFESLCGDLFKKAIDLLPGVLKDAQVSKSDIKDIVLVGGSTRIPKVRAMVRDFFGKEPNKSINADEAVAMGAAIHAAALTGVSGTNQVVVKEVSSLDLGVATSNGLMAVLIPRNTELPAEATKSFTTSTDQQEEANFTICQGPRARWEDNDVLGDFTLPVPALAKGEVHLDATFSVAENGLLTVTAKERSTGETMKGEWASEARLTSREIQRLLEKAQQMRIQDDEARDEARRERYGV